MATKKATTTNKKAPAKKTVAKKTTATAATKTSAKTVSAPAKKQTLGQHVERSLLSKSLWRTLGAEFLGTFLLAAVIIGGQGQPIFVLFGLVGLVLLFGAVSGAHFNPAVTIGAWATRRIGWLRALGYVFAQFLGAAVAFFALSAFLGGATAPTAEQQMYGQQAASLFQANDISALTDNKQWYVFFAEVLGTAILGFAIAVALRAKDSITAAFSAGLGIFVALMVGITAAGFVSASSIINPAVALSLQAYDGVWSYIIYGLGAVLGGVIGFLLHDLIRGRK